MTQAICSQCDKYWPEGQTVCSCGGTARTVQKGIKVQTGSVVQVFTSLIHKAVWEKNWPLIFLYAILQLILATVSYWTNAWHSVGWSVFGSIISTVLGLFIVTKIVREERRS